jgi:hypothetical protein
MDPVTIGILVDGAVTLTEAAMKFYATLQGADLTPEQKQAMRDTQQKLHDSIAALTPIPDVVDLTNPPGDIVPPVVGGQS